MKRLGYAATAAAMALLIYGGCFVFSSLTQQDLYDCSDFTYQEDAQAVYDQDTTDPYGLDGPPGRYGSIPNSDNSSPAVRMATSVTKTITI